MSFGRVGALATGMGLFSKGVGAGAIGLITPVRTMQKTVRNVGRVASGISKQHYKYAGLKSMQLLGTAAGATYATRLIRGRGLFRDRRGRKDRLPYIPFL